jgi:hypothetical protein
MSASIDRIYREQARRSRASKGRFGAGACSTPKTSYDPRCFDVEHLACHYQIAANAVLANVGQTIFTVQIEPTNCPVFDPRAVSASMVDAVDPGLPRNMRWTDVSIQDCPQEAIRGKAPTAATTAFWQNFKWDPRERSGCACPVPWGKFTNNANSFPLTLTGFNPHPAGITVTGSVEVYGDCLTTNDFTQCGARRAMPEIVTPPRSSFPAP